MSRRFRVFLLVSFLLLGLAACTSATPTREPAPEKKPSTIKVVGKGEMEVKADAMYVEFSVLSCGSNLQDTVSENNHDMKNAMEYLRGVGIAEADLKTTDFAVGKVQGPYGDCPEETPYEVRNVIGVTIRNLSRAGEILGGALQNGFNSVDRMYFFVQNPAPYIQQARELAIADAKARAEALAIGWDRELGDPTEILEGDVPVSLIREVNVNNILRYAYGGRGGGGGGGDVPLATGSVDVVVNINITYALK